MGIYPRLAATVLALLVVSAEAATRRPVTSGQSTQGIVTGAVSTVGSFSTPAGYAAFFGSEFTSAHGSTPAFSTGGNPSAHLASYKQQIIKLKPVALLSKSAVALKAVTSLKGGVIGVVGTAALGWAISQIPGAELSGTTPVIVETGQLMPIGSGPGDYFWRAEESPFPVSSSVEGACRAYVATKSSAQGYRSHTVNPESGGGVCTWGPKAQTWINYNTNIGRHGTKCPDASALDAGYGGCFGSTSKPFNDTNYADLQAALASVSNSQWIKDLVSASCQGSLNPSACYDQLDGGGKWLQGPASAVGPQQQSTTTTTSPTGTVSSVTTSSQNKYDYTYGDGYYDYSTTTTTTTNNNGDTTTVTTSDSQPLGEEPAGQENPEESTDFSGEYSDSPFSAVEPFYEQQYPDGLQGVWDDASAQISSSDFLQFLGSFVPSFSGTCPSWSLSFNIMPGANFGTFEFMSLCYIFAFIKIIFMVTATFAARYIMFGG